MNDLQSAVYAVYLQYDEAVDAIVCDPDVAIRFARQVTCKPGLSRVYVPRDVLRCLINMRKGGKLPLKPKAIE